MKAGEVEKVAGSQNLSQGWGITPSPSPPLQYSNRQPTGLLFSGTDSKGMAHETYPGTFLKTPFKWFLLFPVIK